MKKTSQTLKKRWDNAEYRAKRRTYQQAQSLAWKRHPKITEAMSEIAVKFPDLSKIITKKERGIPLS